MSSLIFGGNGFIGRHLHNYLDNEGLGVESFDIGLREKNLKNLKFDYCYQDVRKPIDGPIIASSEDPIFNLAAVHVTPGYEDHEYFDTNINGAINVCKLATLEKTKTIAFTSSISVYGSEEDQKSEEALAMPGSAYGSSKLTAEWIHRTWLAENKDRNLIILRPGVVFGLGEGGNFTRLYKAMRKGLFIFPGRKDTLKSCIYVKDLVRAMAEMTNSNDTFQLYNMCYESPPTIEEICETIAEVTGVKAPRFVLPGSVLKGTANILYRGSSFLGRDSLGVHPERINKLMLSTNISGKRLAKSIYKPRFSLKSAIEDWYEDCGRKGLY